MEHYLKNVPEFVECSGYNDRKGEYQGYCCPEYFVAIAFVFEVISF